MAWWVRSHGRERERLTRAPRLHFSFLFLVSYKKQNSWVGVFVKGQIEPHTMRVFAVVDSAQLNQVMDGRQGLRRAAPVTG